MPACPICATESTDKFEATPYWICATCDAWFQWPQPPKIWHAEHEGDPIAMSDYDKGANESLAGFLFDSVMHGKPGRVLDIGCAYPYLLHRLHEGYGCDVIGMDGEIVANDLGVEIDRIDLDAGGSVACFGRFELIICCHSLEHFYNPMTLCRTVRSMINEGGAWFIRMPDHRVPGFERDLTHGHFRIHPFFHTLTSILQLLVETGDTFEMTEQRPLQPGQRDLILRPIR